MSQFRSPINAYTVLGKRQITTRIVDGRIEIEVVQPWGIGVVPRHEVVNPNAHRTVITDHGQLLCLDCGLGDSAFISTDLVTTSHQHRYLEIK